MRLSSDARNDICPAAAAAPPVDLPPGMRTDHRCLWAALSAFLLIGGCTAPGMKLDQQPTGVPTTTEMNGLEVTLHSLNAPASYAQAAKTLAGPSIDDLRVEKIPPYQVGPQDVLLITVWEHPELTLPLGMLHTDAAAGMVVDSDGNIFFPYVGKIQVAGMSTTQVRETLTSHLGTVLKNPQIDVKVIDFRSQKVYVGGEVHTPAVYNITNVPFTLAEAVNRAGGFLATADDSRLLLTRGDRTWTLNFRELMATGNRIGQILLKDGDSLHVPNAQDDPVYLMGELVKPGSQPLVHGELTLAQAISSAGGILNASARAGSIYVIRKGKTATSVDAFHLDAHNPVSMVLADQFLLNPRDIVYVDAGTLVRWNRVWTLLLPTFGAVSSTLSTATDIKYLK